MHPARTGFRHRSTIAVLLMAVLLFAQWSGLAHRVDHGPLAGFHPDQVSEEKDPAHSCVAFDAAAVADAIHLPAFVTPLLTGTRVLALWSAFESWDAPIVLNFSSRAPPRS